MNTLAIITQELTIMLTPSQRWAITNRTDLVVQVCELKMERGLNWQGMLRLMPEHTSGGSSLDRKLIVEAFASLERS